MADYTGGYRNIRNGGISEEVTQSMAPIENVLNLRKTVLTKTGYPNAINTSFSELVTPPLPLEQTISVEEFFDLYNSIFYDIPVEGDINSHQFLVERSKEYIGISEETDQEIQVLLDEITSLRQNLLDTEQELLEALENTNAPASETISPNIAQTGISSNVGGSSGTVGLSGTY
jgi:hypothetical protein